MLHPGFGADSRLLSMEPALADWIGRKCLLMLFVELCFWTQDLTSEELPAYESTPDLQLLTSAIAYAG